MLPESFIHQIDKERLPITLFSTPILNLLTCKIAGIMSAVVGDAVPQPAEKSSFGIRKNGMF